MNFPPGKMICPDIQVLEKISLAIKSASIFNLLLNCLHLIEIKIMYSYVLIEKMSFCCCEI